MLHLSLRLDEVVGDERLRLLLQHARHLGTLGMLLLVGKKLRRNVGHSPQRCESKRMQRSCAPSTNVPRADNVQRAINMVPATAVTMG